MSVTLSVSLKFTRETVLKDKTQSKMSLLVAQDAACEALSKVIREYSAKNPDPSRPDGELEPNDAMPPRHMFFAITVLWRRQDIEGLLQFLANEKGSKLHMTIKDQPLFYEVVHLYDRSTASSQPLWVHMRTEAPQPGRLVFRVHAPATLMTAAATARLVLRQFEAHHPKATRICGRDNGVLRLIAIEVELDASALRDKDFGVCEGQPRDASLAKQVIPYDGSHNRLDNRRICIKVDNKDAVLLLQISLQDHVWVRATTPLKHKASEAHRKQQERAEAALGDSGAGAAQARGPPAEGREVDVGMSSAAAAAAAPAAAAAAAAPAGAAGAAPEVPMSIDEIGHRLYPLVASTNEAQAGKITGMLLELPLESLKVLLTDEGELQNRIEDAVQALHRAGGAGGGAERLPLMLMRRPL